MPRGPAAACGGGHGHQHAGIEATMQITRRYLDTIVIGISVNIGDNNDPMQPAGG